MPRKQMQQTTNKLREGIMDKHPKQKTEDRKQKKR